MKIRIGILTLLCGFAVISLLYAVEAARSWDSASRRSASAWLDLTQTQANIALASSGKPVPQTHVSVLGGAMTTDERYWSKEEIRNAENRVEELKKILPQLSENESKARESCIERSVFTVLICLSAIIYGAVLFSRRRKSLKTSTIS